MKRLNWAKLPPGACFLRMLLEDDQVLRGSGDDLSNFYYQLALPDSYLKFNVFGKRVSTSILKRFGADSTRPHRLCFRVLGMGDCNACDIAQGLHEGVLKKCAGISPHKLLRLESHPKREHLDWRLFR